MLLQKYEMIQANSNADHQIQLQCGSPNLPQVFGPDGLDTLIHPIPKSRKTTPKLGEVWGVRTSATSDSDTLSPPKKPHKKPFSPLCPSPFPLYPHPRRPTLLLYHPNRHSGLVGPPPLHQGDFSPWPMPQFHLSKG
jgi:hypothetical protein